MRLIGRVGSESSGLELTFDRDSSSQLPTAHGAEVGIELEGVLWRGTLGNPESGTYSHRRYVHRTLLSASDGLSSSTTSLFRRMGLRPGALLTFAGETTNHLRLVAIDQHALVESTTSSATDEVMPTPDIPLNQILYGPPGTGKTFATARLAVTIIDGQAPEDRTALLARYRELRDREQIGFVTFHQSFSYEEFVEGIRPVLDTDGSQPGEVRYECRQGIFQRMCERASTKSTGLAARGSVDFAGAQFWKMSLGEVAKSEADFLYEEAIKKGQLLLGYGGDVDYAGCDDKEAIVARLGEARPDILENSPFAAEAVHRLKNRMEVGDIVVISHGNLRFRAIGKITGTYQFESSPGPHHRRPVQWLMQLDEDEEPIRRERISSKNFSQQTIHELQPSNLNLEAIRELVQAPDAQTPPNHVLIIDEINRGNIAKILGELITLLEPDKRLGNAEELTVLLPYSGRPFGVPANLYLIGTMNTADRSIALMDTALRRRFEFLHVAPVPEVIRGVVGVNGVIGDIDVARLLAVLNERIAALYDRDHCLGHAYFLGVRTLSALRRVFVDRILPLLQEYFYGDDERVCAVLGCPYDAGSSVPGPHMLTSVATRVPGLDPELHDDKPMVNISPLFLEAAEEALAPFFHALVSGAR